jgi:small subunit ribosomal protein S6
MIYFNHIIIDNMNIHKYELLLVLKPSLPENVRMSILNKIGEVIKEGGLSLVTQDNWGKRYLSYPIKKHNEGYYIIYNLQSVKGFSTENIEKISKSLRLMSELIRFGVFSVENFSNVKVQKNI